MDDIYEAVLLVIASTRPRSDSQSRLDNLSLLLSFRSSQNLAISCLESSLLNLHYKFSS